MKKLLTLLFALPFLFLTSCDDTNDLPDVELYYDISGGTIIDGYVYIMRGETLSINSISVYNNDPGNVIITGATYFWDGYMLGANPYRPYGFDIYISPDTRAGLHTLAIDCPVYAEGKSGAMATSYIDVIVLNSYTELPGGGYPEPGLSIFPDIDYIE